MMTACVVRAQCAQRTQLVRCHARCGLLGNPSDGMNGATVSFTVANWHASVTLTPSAAISFTYHALHDAGRFPSLDALASHVERCGVGTGVDLLKALCAVFVRHCQSRGIALAPPAAAAEAGLTGFTLAYETCIPRQAGLAGSSAIVTAGLRCLMAHYGLTAQHIALHEQPGLVLAAEAALGITAGLQDRVAQVKGATGEWPSVHQAAAVGAATRHAAFVGLIASSGCLADPGACAQVYGGLVHMDFAQVPERGYGTYTRLDVGLLRALCLCLVWREDHAGASGKVHSTVKARWAAGDAEVAALVQQLAQLAHDGRRALEGGDVRALGRLMDRNFELRRALFGDEVVGRGNLGMVQVAQSVGAHAKLPGSGGAVLVLCPQGGPQEERLREACGAEGLHCVRLVPAEPEGHVDAVT